MWLFEIENFKVTEPVLSLARANGISANDVYEIDASRKTTLMSENISGFGKTMRITLNDNVMRRGSSEEILSIMGHEIGRYVSHHIYKDFIFFHPHCGIGVFGAGRSSGHLREESAFARLGQIAVEGVS